MPDGTSFLDRFLFFFAGFVLSLIIISTLLLPSGNFTALDVWRFFISPGIVALIAATVGARAGARSHIQASQSDLAQTYVSLLDLVSEDVRINMNLMARVRDKIGQIENEHREPVIYELGPESLHTMFFQDIEYPKLRKLITRESVTDVFNVRNITYVFDRWNHLVDMYYQKDKPLIRDEAEQEIIRHLTYPHDNFIAACTRALDSIDALKTEIAGHLTTAG